MNICFIGMRGAGKSNVSRRISVATKRNVFSTDALIEYEQGGRSVADIVQGSVDGWRVFREAEFAVVQKVTRLDGIIIDAGGGIVVDLDDNGDEVYSERKVDLIRATGPIVWLTGDIARLANKVTTSVSRPTLSDTQTMIEISNRRLPFYRRAADLAIDIEGKARPDIAFETLAALVSRYPELEVVV
ncbi:MAG: shikimate kinase [Actinomycetes bacterium]